MTPTEYVNGLRLAYARHLLKYTDHSVLDISMECGFENPSHFYHLFAASVGHSPAAFRRKFRMSSKTQKTSTPRGMEALPYS